MLQRALQITLGQLRVYAYLKLVPHIFCELLANKLLLLTLNVSLLVAIVLPTLLKYLLHQVLRVASKPTDTTLNGKYWFDSLGLTFILVALAKSCPQACFAFVSVYLFGSWQHDQDDDPCIFC